jgi:hypothetical protein
LLGNGDGTFQAAENYDVGGNPDSVAVGDFTGNGKLDLAVANFLSNTVSILLGNGDGTFQSASSYSVGFGPDAVAVGNFNRDGHLDLAVANQGFFSTSGGNILPGPGTVSVLLGNGDGTFQPAHNYAVGAEPSAVAVGAFTGSGFSDLAVTTIGGVTVLLGPFRSGCRQDARIAPSRFLMEAVNPPPGSGMARTIFLETATAKNAYSQENKL